VWIGGGIVTLLAALVAHTGWHWMIERFGTLRQFSWPAVTAGGVAERRRQEAVGVEK